MDDDRTTGNPSSFVSKQNNFALHNDIQYSNRPRRVAGKG
jgi:hypothetical protein